MDKARSFMYRVATMSHSEENEAKVWILDDIPVDLKVEDVLQTMRARKITPGLTKLVEELAARAREVARPKAMYTTAYVDIVSEQTVSLDGQQFNSRVLRQLLESIGRVFPFVATCGTEMDELDVSPSDLMASYCLDSIKMLAVQAARRRAQRHIMETYSVGKLSRMAPGSLEDWPLQEQRPLFELLGDVESSIGVRLTDKLLMIPVKSVSGIFFPTEVRFESCQLCRREVCQGRRSPYDPGLAARYGV
ncbi:MAG: vitamin B12 dependent-methionine synthase activation domain-containing protein [Chloroflexota bacterium]